MKKEVLLSVGIDIGTSTTQLVFSRLQVENAASAFAVPHFAITQKEILFRSHIHFTPLLSDTEIDTQALRRIVAEEYAKAGVSREQIRTGAVIITGETARKENAQQVLASLSGFAGDFVVATAGPALESVLAGKGAGAQSYSKNHDCRVMNLDIGGGTTNFALFEKGELVDTGCLNVGGRLMKLDETGRVLYISPVLRPYVDTSLGQVIAPEELRQLGEFLAQILERALLGEEVPEIFIADQPLKKPENTILSFSGGVAALMEKRPENLLAYGDLGVYLAEAILSSPLWEEDSILAAESIRATVIGAGSHSTSLSGSTIFYTDINFPMKNLPVAALSREEEDLPTEALARRIRQKLGIYADQPAILCLKGKKAPAFAELCRLADAVSLGLEPFLQRSRPALIAVEADMGKALGQALHMLLPHSPLLCMDAVSLSEGSYLDIGTPIAGGQTLPVVIKTLALG